MYCFLLIYIKSVSEKSMYFNISYFFMNKVILVYFKFYYEDWYYEDYNCIIFDEAHHCGAPQWGETIRELRNLIKNSEDKKMIGYCNSN